MKLKLFPLAIVLVALFSCEADKLVQTNKIHLNGQEILFPDSIYSIKSSNTTSINWDTLQKLSPRIWKTQITPEPVDQLSNSHSPTYQKTIRKLENSSKKVFSLSMDEHIGKTIRIPKKGYLVQDKDTILAIKKVIVGKPQETKVKMNTKPNITSNIQFLDIEHGLPKNKINQSIIDSLGYLWFSTYGGGLMRFDGNSILNYTEEEGVNSNFVNYVNKDQKGNIWAGTDGGGLLKYDGVHFWHYYYDQGLEDIFAAMTEDSNGDIWLGGQAGLSKLTNIGNPTYEELSVFSNLHGLENERINFILEDSKKTIWLGTSEGLRSITNEELTFFDIGITNISGLLEDKNGNLWVSSYTDGFAYYDGENLTLFLDKNAEENNQVNCLLEDKSGNINIGTSKQGLLTFDGANLKAINENHGLLNNSVFALSEDRAGNTWVSNFYDGISKVGRSSFNQILLEGNSEVTNFHSIAGNHNGAIWFGGDAAFVYRYGNNNFEKIRLNKDVKDYPITSICQGSDETTWFSSNSNSTITSLKKNVATHFELLDASENVQVSDIIVDSHGIVWAALYGKGILRYNGDHFSLLQVPSTLLENSFYKVLEDKNGNHFFFDYETIYVLTNNNLRKFRTVGRSISDTCIDTNGDIWLATNQGPVRVIYNPSDKQLTYYSYSYNSKPAGAFLTSIDQSKNGDLWLGTDTKGVQVLKPIYDTKDDSDYRVVSINKDDGFMGLSIFPNAGFIDSEENYWLGTKRGATKVNIPALKFNTNIPKVFLTSVHVNDMLYDRKKIAGEKATKTFGFSEQAVKDSSKIRPFMGIPENLELKHNYNRISFGFGALEWKAPNDIKYQYKVDGLDRVWSMASKNNFAQYRNIPSGEYKFRLRAVGESGASSQEVVYPFTILPPWWLTGSARSLYALLFMLAIWGFVELRISSVRKKTEKQYELKLLKQVKLEEGRQLEKEHMAKELHDGVLGSIFGIRMGLDNLSNVTEEKQKSYREKYIKRLSQLEDEIRKLSRNLSPSTAISNIVFTKIIEEFLEEQCPPNNLEYVFTTSPQIEWNQHTGKMKFDIYRIIQESVQNSIRHANATRIEIDFKKTKDGLQVQITDNGIGFPEEFQHTGIGLKNIQSRVKAHQGMVKFENNLDHGAVVKIYIPIATS